MKNIEKTFMLFTIFLFLTINSNIKSQIGQINEVLVKYKYGTTTYIVPTAPGLYQIGQESGTYDPTLPSSEDTYRTELKYNLSIIPQGAYVTEAILTARADGNSTDYGFSIKHTSGEKGGRQLWDEIGTPNPLFSSLGYNQTHSLSSSVLNSAIQESLEDGYIYLGYKSSSESDPGSGASLTTSLNISYTIEIILNANNNFIDNTGNGTRGQMKIDNVVITIPAEGYNFIKTAGQSLSLEAVSPQIDNAGYQRIWYSGIYQPSSWTSDNEIVELNQLYSFNVSGKHYNKTFRANFTQIIATTSGNLSSNETWYWPVTLTGDISVPTGITLMIETDGSANLNNYYLKSTGGTIIVQSGGAINGYMATVSQSGTTNGYYPTFSSGAQNIVANQVLDYTGYYENLSQNHTLPSNVTVNIINGADLNLNGKFINASGGSIVVESGGDIIGYSAIVKEGNTFKGYYSSLIDALNNAVSGQTIELTGRFDLTGNVTVPADVTLVLGSNSILDLNGYYLVRAASASIIDYGALIEELKTTTYDEYLNLYGFFSNANTAVSVGGSDKAHILQTGTHSGNIGISSLSNVYISGAGTSTSINGDIDINSSSNVSINCLKMGAGYNIYFNGGTSNSIYSITFNGTSNLAYFYNTSNFYASYLNCTAGSGSYTGILISNSSGTLSNSTLENSYNAVGAYNNAYSNVNYNAFCTNTKDIVTYSGAYVTANSNIYSGDPSQTTAAYGGYISITGSTNQCASLLAKGYFPQAYAGFFSIEFLSLAESYTHLLQLISFEDRKNKNYDLEKLNARYIKLIYDVEKFIEQSESNKEIKLAMGILSQGYRIVNNNEGFGGLLNKLYSSKKYQHFESYLNKYDAEVKKAKGLYKEALTKLNEVVSKSGLDDDFMCEVLFEKANLLKYHFDDITSANELLNKILKEYPDNYMTVFAIRELKSTGGQIQKQIVTEVALPTEFNLASHPNPFNPSTTISYSLPQKGHVVLKIYDVLGKEITELVNETKDAGLYAAMFNGNNLSSGMYIVNLQVQANGGEEFNQSRKILLMK